MQEKQIQPINKLFDSRYHFQAMKSRRSERGDLLEYFTNTINKARINTKYKQLSISYIGNLLSVYTTEDLYCLQRKCSEAKNFSACFFYFAKCTPKKN
jgi:hypothetical protein